LNKPLPFANKNLGQHFLRDQKVIELITEDFKSIAKSIIEIGPGPGILTENLSKHELPFKVIEKDRRFLEYLDQFIPLENIQFEDALKSNLEELFPGSNDTWLVSNLPYNVSSQLFIKFLQSPSIKYLTLMFQKEVGNKIFKEGAKKNDMSSLLVLGQTYFEMSQLCLVPPGAFVPPPKVQSVVLSGKRKENPVISLDDFKKFEKFLRQLFQFKRKKITKNLHSYSKDLIKEVFEELDISLDIRAEALDLGQVQQVFIKMENINA
jgi:16S rRNA (adenine1518-N6/adenine1519-N6)-dimethyltransferase